MTSKNYKAKTEPAESGNGFAGVVLDGKTVIYSSEDKHGEPGIFGSELEAQSHARAWAAALQAKDDVIARLREDRRERLGGEVLVLTTEAIKDTEKAKGLAKDARTCKANAEARHKRIADLARAAEDPKVRITWDRKEPGAVSVTPEECAWTIDHEPEPLENQLSLPGVVWHVTNDGDRLRRIVGTGRVEVEIDGDRLTISLGSEEHVVEAAITGFAYSESEPVPEPSKPGASLPKAPKKRSKPKAGKLVAAQLVKRIEINRYRPETLLAIYELETKGANRVSVIKAIDEAALEIDDPSLLLDLEAIADDRPSTGLDPDYAAAALVTAKGTPDPRVLEELIPACKDTVAIGDVLDDELEGDGRDEVVTVLRGRLAELREAEGAA